MRVSQDEQQFLADEIAAYMSGLTSPETRQPYEELSAAIEQGEIPEALLEPLGQLLALSLETGRLRRLHGAHAVMSATRLFLQTPQGRALRATADETNQALAALKGHSLERV